MEEKDTPGKNDLKASAVFAFGLHPSPIVELSSITNMKSGGLFVPALEARTVSGPNQVSTVKFALLSCDLLCEDDLEKFRGALHQRIDRAVDNYKARWAKPAEAPVAELAAEAPTPAEVEPTENPL